MNRCDWCDADMLPSEGAVCERCIEDAELAIERHDEWWEPTA